MHRNVRAGFTFIEMLIAFSIIAVIMSLSAASFISMRDASALRIARQEVYTSLQSARSLTLGSREDTVYGVRISATGVTRFTGGVFNASSTSNETFIFENGVTATGTLLNTSIIFSRLSGESNASGTMYLQDSNALATRTIHIYGSGLIE